MSHEVKSRGESPCLVARLMGLDTLPHKQPVQEKKSSTKVNKHQRRNVEKTQNRYSSSRKISKDEQQFRDIYEVLEAKTCGIDSNPHQGTADSYLTENETGIIHKKLMDAKSLSTDENFQDSKEFYDVLEVLESSEDFTSKFLQQPDSLLRRHINDAQVAPCHSKCRRRSCAISSNASGEQKEMYQQSRRRNSVGIDRSFQKHKNNPLHKRNSTYAVHNSFTTSKGNIETANAPTRIIILKPNLGKPPDPQKLVSSPPPTPLSDCNNSTMSRDARGHGKKILVDYKGSEHNQRGARETAKKLARGMGNIVDSASMNISPPSRFRGCCGDDSSSSVSSNEKELDSPAGSSKRYSVRNTRRKSPLTRTESAVSREAKKRMSERWKKTHTPEEIEVVNQGSTLGEMLSLSNNKKRASNNDARIRPERYSTVTVKSDAAKSVRSLGISNRESQDRCGANPSSIVFESSRSTSNNMRNVSMERNKGVKGIDAQNDGLPLRKLRYNNKYQATARLKKEHCETSAEFPCTENQVRCRFREINLPPQHHRCSVASIANSGSIPEVEHEKRTITGEPSSETSSSLEVQGNFSSELHDLPIQEPLDGPHRGSESVMHYAVTEKEVSSSSKEAAQSSPVSIFDAPFQDDASSAPDRFENLNPDLNGICLQQHLQKSGPEAIDQRCVQVLSDHGIKEASVGLSEDDRAKKQWKTFYIADVLANPKFKYAGPETFMSLCHSPQSPINLIVFEELEKKYDNQSSSRSERRLLFDCINSKIQELYQQVATWHRSRGMAAASIGAVHNRERFIHMCESLASHQKRVGKDTKMEVSTSESKWMDLLDEIDLIGRELEELLLNELIVEHIFM